MTREKAIAVLGNAKYELSNRVASKYCREKYEAIEMAIKALEQEPTIRNCFGCKYSKDNHCSGIEECHLCMWENQYTPTTNLVPVVLTNEKGDKRNALLYKPQRLIVTSYMTEAFAKVWGYKIEAEIEPQERSDKE